jgi:hypothetical protein
VTADLVGIEISEDIHKSILTDDLGDGSDPRAARSPTGESPLSPIYRSKPENG